MSAYSVSLSGRRRVGRQTAGRVGRHGRRRGRRLTSELRFRRAPLPRGAAGGLITDGGGLVATESVQRKHRVSLAISLHVMWYVQQN